MLHLATSIARPNLVAMGTCFGKFSKAGKFKLGVTCLDWIATYAKYKVSLALPLVRFGREKSGYAKDVNGRADAGRPGVVGASSPICGTYMVEHTSKDEWLWGVECQRRLRERKAEDCSVRITSSRI
jgi:hypothetical protein